MVKRHSLLQLKILCSLGKEPQIQQQPLNMHFYSLILKRNKINNKELPADQLGVKAVDDHTFEVELERPVPYFISLTAFPTFLPINEEFFKAQGDKYALEDNTILYNGAFTLSDWKHEQSFKFKKTLPIGIKILSN